MEPRQVIARAEGYRDNIISIMNSVSRMQD